MQFFQALINQFHRYLYPRDRIYLTKHDRGLWYELDTMMFEASFELLCRFVEDDCALEEASSRWEQFKIKWFPRKWRLIESRTLGLTYIDRYMMSDPTDGEHQQLIRKNYSRIKELYVWYRDIYPNQSDPWDELLEPEFPYVDTNGMPTKEIFGTFDDGSGRVIRIMNYISDDYATLLNHAGKIEDERRAEEQQRLNELIALRHNLWL